MTKNLCNIIFAVFFSFILQGCESFSRQKSDNKAPPMYSATPDATDREQHKPWIDRHQAKKKEAKSQQIDLLMIGDSITQAWETAGLKVWNKYYQPRNGFNIGIGGDRTEHVLWRLHNGAVENMQPKVAVLMIGTNNTGFRMDPAAYTAAGIEAITKDLRQRLPNTKILLLAIFPRNLSVHNEMRLRNKAINKQIATLADEEHIYFLNINHVFLDKQGMLNAKVMPDKLHLSEEGYQLWAEAMEPTLRKLLD